MHILKHILTEEEKSHLELYLEMINSNDSESTRLAGSLFYEEFKNYRIPCFGYKFYLTKLNFPNSQSYWMKIIESLLEYNYYCY